MLASKYLFFTSKNIITNNKIDSYYLMTKAGMIKKLSSGIYTWLPTGLKIIKNFKKIIRHEMNNINFIEILMPIIQPSNIWKTSGRINDYGNELFKISDRNKKNFFLGPTHEEVITYLINNEIKSYKNLPLNLYQIQVKFRDEIRSRLGVVRSKEFLMKDGYSFHIDEKSLKKTYNIVLNTYKKIFDLIKLKYYIVKGDNSFIGGKISHEFHILSNNGEDSIALSKYGHAYNIESVKFFIPKIKLNINTKFLIKQLIKIDKSVNFEYIAKKLHSTINNIIKIIIIKNTEKKFPLVALLIRSDYEISISKIEKLNKNIFKPLYILSQKEISHHFKINKYSLGPINLNIPIIADYSVVSMINFIIGSNINNKYYININWKRDLPLPENIQDIRKTYNKKFIFDKKNSIIIKKSIEIAHIFQLGTKYSKLMNTFIQNEKGNKVPLYMGCYGIGVSRIIASIIEQNHDINGIFWPSSLLAPFKVAIIPINMYKYNLIKKISFDIYQKITSIGIEVILDDRKESPGVMFADIDLIGIPHMIIISNNNIINNNVEYKFRQTGEQKIISVNNIVDFISNKEKFN
ncbi:proline--tRNA ligase [Enterobacteriaceae endosymbiont of Plateumaris braccata]|uniref:proline--tRNA ligase n=1 Tax=Enterobacteriaceae endosymbiont of Plateumaris braccata TaxID=2675793 RepID=UPI0014493256|nr:proline--tRNA ligase [Enterobacteriaceae endosymbiont of Plateumaris braccata]QJC28182.1 proline--tRNA ligase [Enterobacteriaceae endosymbiont of Plateumaris braccata]